MYLFEDSAPEKFVAGRGISVITSINSIIKFSFGNDQ